MRAVCDAGCKEEFDVNSFDTVRMDNGIEKTFFTCNHCDQEYIAFYTDVEIREIQKKIRYQAARGKDVEELQQENKEKMNALRRKMEG